MWWLQGPVSISDKTSYRKISWSLNAARFVFRIVRSLWNLTGTSAALLPTCQLNFAAIWQFKLPISRLRDITRSYDNTFYPILKRGPGVYTVIKYSFVFVVPNSHFFFLNMFVHYECACHFHLKLWAVFRYGTIGEYHLFFTVCSISAIVIEWIIHSFGQTPLYHLIFAIKSHRMGTISARQLFVGGNVNGESGDWSDVMCIWHDINWVQSR